MFQGKKDFVIQCANPATMLSRVRIFRFGIAVGTVIAHPAQIRRGR
jgi:hypothetical protein